MIFSISEYFDVFDTAPNLRTGSEEKRRKEKEEELEDEDEADVESVDDGNVE